MPMYFHSQKKALGALEKRLAKLKHNADGILIYVLGQGGVVSNVRLTLRSGKQLFLTELQNEAAVTEWLIRQRFTNCIVICDDIN